MNLKDDKQGFVTYLALGLLSAAIIAFQLVLMQVLSIVQWYHFAYMVISIAMLGFGAAGTCISLFEKKLLKNYKVLFPALCMLCGLEMAVVVRIANIPGLQFDTFLLFNDFSHIGKLLGAYVLMFLPFFTGALAVGLTFVNFASNIGRLYFADLLGSGLGGLAAPLLMWTFLPSQLPATVAFLPVLAGIASIPVHRLKPFILYSVLALAGVSFMVITPGRLNISQYKDLARTLLLPNAEIVAESNSPHGFIQTVRSPALRNAPGLSLNYTRPVPVRPFCFNNADGLGPLLPLPQPEEEFVLDYTTNAVAYSMGSPGQALILKAGTGQRAIHALSHGARVTFVEENLLLLNLLQQQLAPFTDSILFMDQVQLHRVSSRTFLMTSDQQYDLITLPPLSAFGGTSGLNALREEYLLTIESFREMWHRLSPEGMISVSSWIDYPARHSLKLLATLREVLAAEQVGHPAEHIAAVRNWGMITFLVKKKPFRDEEIDNIRQFCQHLSFDPVILKGLQKEERTQYNQLQDTLYFEYVDAILSDYRERFYSEYDFHIRPATDNRPYFSQFLNWKSIPHIAEHFGNQNLPFLEAGYLIVGITFVQMVILAAFLILIPLLKRRLRKSANIKTMLYFSGLGIGYMFIEIVLIQQFVLFFGIPIYATAAVISCLLISSGLGSYYSSTIRLSLRQITLLIVVLILLYASFLPATIRWLIDLPLALKTSLLFTFTAPLGFIMGLPFPKGIFYLAENSRREIPWAWGINGYFSVISTALATIIAIEAGFFWVFVVAASAYLVAAAAAFKSEYK